MTPQLVDSVSSTTACQQAGRDAGTEPLGRPPHLIGRIPRTLADEQRHALARVEHRGCLGQVVLGGQHPRRTPLRRRRHHPVLVRHLLGRLGDLDVVRQDHDAGRPRGQSGAKRAVDDHGRLLGREDRLDVLGRDVLEEGGEVDLLLVLRAERRRGLLAHDRDHGLVVELGVVQPVEQVHGARALGADDDPDPAGVLRVADGHERGVLLVPGLDEHRVAVRAAQRAHEPLMPSPE